MLYLCCTQAPKKEKPKPLDLGLIYWLSASTEGGNRTRTLLQELDFESSASTNSATSAKVVAEVVEFILINFGRKFRQYHFGKWESTYFIGQLLTLLISAGQM